MDLDTLIEEARADHLAINTEDATEIARKLNYDRKRIDLLYTAKKVNLFEYEKLVTACRKQRPAIYERPLYLRSPEKLQAKIEQEGQEIISKASLDETEKIKKDIINLIISLRAALGGGEDSLARGFQKRIKKRLAELIAL